MIMDCTIPFPTWASKQAQDGPIVSHTDSPRCRGQRCLEQNPEDMYINHYKSFSWSLSQYSSILLSEDVTSNMTSYQVVLLGHLSFSYIHLGLSQESKSARTGENSSNHADRWCNCSWLMWIKYDYIPSGKLTSLLKMAIYSWFTHQKWWFSIVMFVYQRVNLHFPIVFLWFSHFPMVFLWFSYGKCQLWFSVCMASAASLTSGSSSAEQELLAEAKNLTSQWLSSWGDWIRFV